MCRAGDLLQGSISWATGRSALTATQQQNLQLQRRLQQDSIQLSGRTIYLNPFLYWRRFDSNTDRWLREPGQLSEEQIVANRTRFYPELDWKELDAHLVDVRDGAVDERVGEHGETRVCALLYLEALSRAGSGTETAAAPGAPEAPVRTAAATAAVRNGAR